MNNHVESGCRAVNFERITAKTAAITMMCRWLDQAVEDQADGLDAGAVGLLVEMLEMAVKQLQIDAALDAREEGLDVSNAARLSHLRISEVAHIWGATYKPRDEA